MAQRGSFTLVLVSSETIVDKQCKCTIFTEFFEPQNLKTPPLGAEQFLQDLRRMISMAREKIRTRRHVPQRNIVLV